MDIRNIEIHNINFEEFIKAIDLCKNDVYLETEEGDVLNLKSKLCQMIGLASVFSNPEISIAKIRCVDPDDESMLFRFNLYGEIPNENK